MIWDYTVGTGNVCHGVNYLKLCKGKSMRVIFLLKNGLNSSKLNIDASGYLIPQWHVMPLQL